MDFLIFLCLDAQQAASSKRRPSDMKGLVKLATASRSELMVRGAMATSASCQWKRSEMAENVVNYKDEFNWDFNCIKNSRLFGGKYSTNRLSSTQLNSNMTDMMSGDRNWFGNRPTEALNGVSVGTFGSITKYGFWRWGKATSCRRLCRPLQEGWVRLGSTELNWKSSWTELKNSRTVELSNNWTHP